MKPHVVDHCAGCAERIGRGMRERRVGVDEAADRLHSLASILENSTADAARQDALESARRKGMAAAVLDAVRGFQRRRRARRRSVFPGAGIRASSPGE